MMSAAAFLVNYGGKVLTNPVSHRVLKNMVDANLPETIRLANFARLVRMYPEEWMAFDQDLAELEMQQKKYNRSSMVDQKAQTTKGGESKSDSALVEDVKRGMRQFTYKGKKYIGRKSPDGKTMIDVIALD